MLDATCARIGERHAAHLCATINRKSDGLLPFPVMAVR